MKNYHFGLIVGIYLFCFILYIAFYYSPGLSDVTQTIIIQSGMTNRVIAQDLKDSGLITSPALFLAFSFLSDQKRLIAGNYQFRSGETISQIIDKIAQGRFYQVKITFP